MLTPRSSSPNIGAVDGRLDAFDAPIAEALRACISRGPGLAVFDADHTLYCHDAGEEFYQYLIAGRHLEAPVLDRDAFAEYRALEARDEVAAYLRLATDMAGLHDAHLAELARAFFDATFVPRIYPAMRRLIADLLEARWRVHLVSASPRWPIQAAARHFGLSAEHVIGIDLQLEDGVLTDRLAYELPYGAGKVKAIQRFLGHRPALAAGDSAADRFMLDTSTDAALVLAYDGHASQRPLLARAAEAGWLVQAVAPARPL